MRVKEESEKTGLKLNINILDELFFTYSKLFIYFH